MKNYIKPEIKIETIEINDVILVSSSDATLDWNNSSADEEL